MSGGISGGGRSERDFGSGVPAPGGRQTPQVPPKPKDTFPFSTITGTSRLPSDQESICFMFSCEALTLTYSNGTCRLA